MLIAKVFLPLSTPGLLVLGMGTLATVDGVYNVVEIVAILVGLLVVAIAGISTIRSNVGKIWREQAEGEKAAREERDLKIAEMLKEHAAETAQLRLEHAEVIAALTHEAEGERDLKNKALAELADANLRTDQGPVIELLREILVEMRPPIAAR